MKYLSLLLLLFFAFSCSDEDTKRIPDIYVAGIISNSGTSANRAGYWKNGVAVALTDGTTEAGAVSIAISGKDVYVLGYEHSIDDRNISITKCWKNGSGTVLTDGYANSLAVSGSDVYVAGSLNNVATYWKNGTPMQLTGGSNNSFANSIVVSGDDVYVAGTTMHLQSDGDGVATYWKNGTPVPLNYGYMANSIAVSGSDVYVAGWLNNVATYWKNGTPVVVAESPQSFANFIEISGKDVYVLSSESTGNNSWLSKCWKNGIELSLWAPDANSGFASALPPARANIVAYSVAVSGNDVYVSGHIDGVGAVYWKNGAVVILAGGESASSIVVN